MSPEERWKWLPAELKNFPIVPFPEPGGPKIKTAFRGASYAGKIGSSFVMLRRLSKWALRCKLKSLAIDV